MKPPRQERCGRGAAWNLAKDVYKLKEESQDTFYSLAEDWEMPAPSLKSQKSDNSQSTLELLCIC